MRGRKFADRQNAHHDIRLNPSMFSQHSSILRRYSLLMKVKDCPVACAHRHDAIFAPDAVNYEQVSNYGFQGGAPSGSF